jgi:hypothetical protein
MVRRLFAVAALQTLAACGDDASSTELVLVADCDVTRADSIELSIEAAGVARKSARAARADAPAYLTIVRDQGTLGPVTVSARALAGSEVVLVRTHVVSFVPDSARVVPLHLSQSCVTKSCAPTQTCSQGSCVDRELAESALARWTGTPPMLPDGGAVTSSPPLPTMMNANTCDGREVDLQTDHEHCGACNVRCSLLELCRSGQCGTLLPLP